MFDPAHFLRALCQLPHRGAATPNETAAANLIADVLTSMGATVSREPFQTPKTYVTIIYWLIGGLLTGLALVPVTGVAVGLVAYFAWLAWRYFNWQYSFVTKFPGQHTAFNISGHWPAARADAAENRTVILMAHYDTAPVSLLHGSKQRAGFRTLLIGSLLLMGLAVVVALLEAAGVGLPVVTYLRYGLMAYFVVQAIIGTAGYWLNGYANGASDKATGVAAALATANQLRQLNLPHLDLHVVLTSAKEVGMVGAYRYVEAHKRSWKPRQTTAINFDTLGAGQLTVIEQTGTLETIRYDNPPTQTARQLLQTDAFRDRADVGQWHTGDFDSVWFVRNRIPVLALCALDTAGRMPRIHQPADTLDVLDPTAMYTAIDLAVAVIKHDEI